MVWCKIKTGLAVTLASWLAACAGVGPSASPAAPAPAVAAGAVVAVPDARRVSGDPAAVRERLLRRLKAQGFRIEQDSAAGLVVSLQADPQRDVDCGMVTGPAGNGLAESRFPAAQAMHRYRLPLKGKLYGVTRQLELAAQASLQWQPVAAAQTEITLAVRYRLTRSQLAVAEGVPPIRTRDELVFAGGERAAFANAPTRCAANGRLEAEILALAAGQSAVPAR